MSKDTDITVEDVEAINELLADMFNEEPSATDLATVVTEVTKMEGGLLEFMQDEQIQVERVKEWVRKCKEDGNDGIAAPLTTYQSSFEGTGMGLCTQGIIKSKLDRVQEAVLEDIAADEAKEKRKRQDELLYLDNKIGSKADAMNQFFQSGLKFDDDFIGDADRNLEDFKALDKSEIEKLEREFVGNMRAEKVYDLAGIKSAESEIDEINRELSEVMSHFSELQGKLARLQNHFGNFIENYTTYTE